MADDGITADESAWRSTHVCAADIASGDNGEDDGQAAKNAARTN